MKNKMENFINRVIFLLIGIVAKNKFTYRVSFRRREASFLTYEEMKEDISYYGNKALLLVDFKIKRFTLYV